MNDLGYIETLENNLMNFGYAYLPNTLNENQSDELIYNYENDIGFRKTIKMERYSYGQGEYKYFKSYPDYIARIIETTYSYLYPIANKWNLNRTNESQFPIKYDDFKFLCRGAGQTKVTTLILRYKENDYNCLHQDNYGDIYFPFQVMVPLNRPGIDFEGGDFVLTFQRARVQSKVVIARQNYCDGIIFCNRTQPHSYGSKTYRVNVKHGVSPLISGVRYALGIIFHLSET